MATATKSGAPDPLIGRVIGERFTITSLLARGGMGKVYRAEQSPLGRVCAIKILNPNYVGDADPEFHRRFFREASITSKITHPNSVTIFDYGKTDDEIYYMAMEYLEGQTLHMALREAGPMPEERVGRIAAQICRALREAHALGVIHRDLKPANIFLTRHGDDDDFVKVLDFGLVKHISERPEEQLTQTGLFMGSPKYMAPEQIQGGVVDFRTDVYSLGIIMYEMLAGKVPFDRPTSVNILMAHVGEPPPPMREVNPNLACSPAFEQLVMRCIAKNPDERVATMDDVLQAIKATQGAAMTGQLMAANATGGYAPAQSYAPLPFGAAASSQNPRVAPAQVLSSASHTPMPLLRADATGEGSGPLPAPRSRGWIAIGVVLAAVVGGVLGIVAFRITTPEAPSRPATSPAPPASASVAPPPAPAPAPAPAPSATASTSPGAAREVPTAKTVLFTTDPPGVTVRDEHRELCRATPCEVVFAADDAGRARELRFEKKGLRPEARLVTPAEGNVTLKMGRSGAGGAPRPAPTAAAATASTAATTAGSAKPEASGATPSGFKDLPY